MIIEQLTLEGFLSYKKKQKIVFPNTSICLINGIIDSNPNISNGAGKSGLLETVPVNFFGKIGGRGELLDEYINDTMNHFYTEVIFKVDDVRYKSVFSKKRSSSAKNEIFYDSNNKKIKDAKWKKTDKKISLILGLGFKTYNSTIYLNERDALNFIDGTAKDRKDILN